MPKNELPRKSLEKKVAEKRLEPRRISPEEQKSIDKWNEGEEEREKKAREAEEARKRKEEEEKREIERKTEFRKTCEKKLMPIFKKIQSLVFKGQESEVSNNTNMQPIYGGWGFNDVTPKGLYKISLRWNYYESFQDNHDASSGLECGWGSEITLSVVLDTEWDKESHFIIKNISEDKLVEIRTTERNWIKKILLGNEPVETERVWVKKITLNDPDWKTQVEDYILEELKQKRAI